MAFMSSPARTVRSSSRWSTSTAGRTWSGSTPSRGSSRCGSSGSRRSPRLLRSLLLALCTTVVLSVWFQAIAATVSLVWNPSLETAGYRVYRSQGDEAFQRVMETATTNATAEVSSNVPTRFYITAFNAVGESGPSNVLTNTPITEPPPPTNPPPLVPLPKEPQIIWMNVVNPHRLDIGWTAFEMGAVTWVERSVDGGNWQRMATLAPGVMHWSDTSFWKKRDHSYRLKSCIEYGCSGYSTVKTYTAP